MKWRFHKSQCHRHHENKAHLTSIRQVLCHSPFLQNWLWLWSLTGYETPVHTHQNMHFFCKEANRSWGQEPSKYGKSLQMNCHALLPASVLTWNFWIGATYDRNSIVCKVLLLYAFLLNSAHAECTLRSWPSCTRLTCNAEMLTFWYAIMVRSVEKSALRSMMAYQNCQHFCSDVPRLSYLRTWAFARDLIFWGHVWLVVSAD